MRLSHLNIESNAAAIVEYLGIGPDDRAITSLPMHYCYGLSVAHSYLAAGASLVLTDASVANPAFWELARAQRVTSFAGVPRTFDLLDRVGFSGLDLPDLRYVTQAGGRLAPDAVRRYARLGRERGWQLVVMYGQTEATARMSYLSPGMAGDHPESIGAPIPGGAFEIRPIPDADDPDVGELVYRGPNVMLGYAESPADLANGREITELRTGDLARRTPAGLYEIVGRTSRFVKPFGLRIDLDLLERLLGEHGIDAVCAGDDQRIVVAVGADADRQAVESIVSERTGLPARLVTALGLDEVPRRPSGKPDYSALAARVENTDQPGATGSVAAIFADVLGRPDVGDDDSFSSLGGDSLSYVEASVALEEILGELPADWPGITVAELAQLGAESGPGRRWLGRMETDVALRAGAITLVVASHMTDFWPAGGAHLLLALAGYSFARFQLAGGDARGRLRRWRASIGRVALPSVAWIALLSLLVGGYGLGAVLLVNNVVGDPALSGARWHYWFIEALVQILVVVTAAFSIPAVRRLERRFPFAFAIGLTAVLIVPALAAVTGSDEPSRFFLPWVVAWIFTLGWAAHRARTPTQRAIVATLAIAVLLGFFDDLLRGAVVLAGVLALLLVPSVPVPRPLVRAVAAIAAASLAIYLTHWQVWPELEQLMPTSLAIAGTLLVGVAAWTLARGSTRIGDIAVRRRRLDPSERRVAGAPADL